MNRRVYIIGYMGAGKSSLAQALAQIWHVPWQDSDALLEEQFGVPADRQLAEDEQLFRLRECRLLSQLAATECGVFSLGGGIVEREGNRELLRALPVLFLDTDLDTCWLRVSGEARQRPLAVDYTAFASLFYLRRELYLQCAWWRVDGQLPSQELVKAVEREMGAL